MPSRKKMRETAPQCSVESHEIRSACHKLGNREDMRHINEGCTVCMARNCLHSVPNEGVPHSRGEHVATDGAQLKGRALTRAMYVSVVPSLKTHIARET